MRRDPARSVQTFASERLTAVTSRPGAMNRPQAAAGPGPHGIVHFVPDGGRVRFQVDIRQAEAAGLTISSKLLALAVRVVR